MAHILQAIFSALLQAREPLCQRAGRAAGTQRRARAGGPTVPDEELDIAWEEPVAFDGCSSKGQAKPGQAQPIHFVKTEKALAGGKYAVQQGVSP
jgi:nitrate reductase delta subunit